MALREVHTCDFFANIFDEPMKVAGSSFKHPVCQKLADGECAICLRDGCEDHLQFKLTVDIKTISPMKAPPNQGTPVLNTTTREAPTRICGECVVYFGRLCNMNKAAGMEIKSRIEHALAEAIKDTQAARAAEALEPKT